MIKPFDDYEEDNNQPIPLPAPESMTQIHTKLKRRAEYEASTKFNNDQQSVFDRNGEWPLDEAILREASTKADVFVRPYVDDTDFDLEAERQRYIQCYVEEYRVRYGGTLPNKDLKKVRDEASKDARIDRQDAVDMPSEQELNFHAIIRIQEIFGYETRLARGYLTHIMQHVPQYKQAYKEERDRLARSSPFLER